MNNPVVVDCPEHEWTKVATNVTSALIHRIRTGGVIYNQTYRLTGDDPPDDDTEAVSAFIDDQPEIVSASAGIDVYIKSLGGNGKVRVSS